MVTALAPMAPLIPAPSDRPPALVSALRTGRPCSSVMLQEFATFLQPRARPRTVKAYLYEVGKWFDWLQVRNRKPNQKNAQEFLDELLRGNSAPSSVALAANAIRRWFKSKDLTVEIDSPKVQLGEPEYLELDKVEELIAACRNPLEKALIVMLFDTGCRISEVLNLELKDIDWGSGLITVTRKGGRVAQVNMSEHGSKALKDWLDKRKSVDKSVFMSMSYLNAWRMVKAIGERAGIDVHPHMLRHSRAVHILESGEDMYVAQQVLGHTNIATTMNVYGRLKPMALKKRIPKW